MEIMTELKKLNKNAKNYLKNKERLLNNGWEIVQVLNCPKYTSTWCLFERNK